jgi:hypothetical protein
MLVLGQTIGYMYGIDLSKLILSDEGHQLRRHKGKD